MYNALQTIGAFEAGDAAKRERNYLDARKAAGQSVLGGDYLGGANALFGAGDMQGGLSLMQYGDERKAAAADMERTDKTRKLQTLQSFLSEMKGLDPAARAQAIRAQSERLGSIGVPIDQLMAALDQSGGIYADPDLTEDLQGIELELRSMGVAPPEAEGPEYMKSGDDIIALQSGEASMVYEAPEGTKKPISIGGRLVDPETYEVLYEGEPDPTASMNARTAADRLAFDELQYEEEKLGSGRPFNENFQDSPFENLGIYQNGKLIPINYEVFGESDPAFDAPPEFSNTPISPVYRDRDRLPRPIIQKDQSTFDKELDREAGKDAAEWLTGGESDSYAQLKRLQAVIGTLRKGEHNVTGPLIGNLPGRAVLAPMSKQMEDLVGEVVQRNLRAVLGGQFTEQEGLLLMRRAYDSRLPEEYNAARLEVLYNQMLRTAVQRSRAARYGQRYGSLIGYQGHSNAMTDLYAALDDFDAANGLPKRNKPAAEVGVGEETEEPEGDDWE